MIAALLEVFAFELKRSLTFSRLAMWGAMAIFPAVLLAIVRLQLGEPIPRENATLAIFVLVPQVSCLLGLLLWATPAIQAEQEGQTWIYLATRPHGKIAVVLGKYLIAIAWTISAGIISVSASVLASSTTEPERLWATVCGLVVLASLSYGSLFLLIGVLVTRRAIAAAVSYTLLIEFALSFAPATINKLTVSYRLRALLADGIGLDALRSRAEILFGEQATTSHLLFVVGYSVCLLAVTLFIVLFREVPMNVET